MTQRLARWTLFALVAATGFYPLTLHADEAPSLNASLQKVLDDYVSDNPAVAGVIASLKSAQLDLNFAGASGHRSTAREQRLTVDAPLRQASVTKTYVAATVLALMERGHIDIYKTIDAYLSPSTLALLEQGGVSASEITVRQLLSHTSGVADYVNDAGFVTTVQANPSFVWTRAKQLALAAPQGQRHGRPGERYRYSDTGYILLGEIVEEATGKALHEVVRDVLRFNALALDATWWELFEPHPQHLPPRPSQYFNGVDTRDWHPSLDLFGGGGLVATMEDVASFYNALFSGHVFATPATLTLMRSAVAPDYGGPTPNRVSGAPAQYALGLFVYSHGDLTVLGHAGAWGTMGGYIPSLDLAFGWAANQTASGANHYATVFHMVDLVVAHREQVATRGQE